MADVISVPQVQPVQPALRFLRVIPGVLLLAAVEIVGSLAFMTFLGRLFKLKPKLTTLLAVGSAVCGVSAIIATKGAIEADDEDSSFSIAAILALGALALFTFP